MKISRTSSVVVTFQMFAMVSKSIEPGDVISRGGVEESGRTKTGRINKHNILARWKSEDDMFWETRDGEQTFA